jgi:hypothetical protein
MAGPACGGKGGGAFAPIIFSCSSGRRPRSRPALVPKMGVRDGQDGALHRTKLIRHDFATKKPQFKAIERLSNWP